MAPPRTEHQSVRAREVARRGLAAGVALRRSVAALALAVTGLGCGNEPAPAPAPPPVYVEQAEAHDVADRISATGQLLAKAEAVVAAQVAGQITAIAADEGSAVAAGTVVVEIDPERRQLEGADAAARVVEAQAQLEEARRQATRAEKLHDDGAVSDAHLDEAHTNLRMARSRLAAEQARRGLAERALRDANVRAPFAGLVARRLVNAGEYVQPGQHLFHLVALDPIEVEFFVAEVDSSRVAVGQSVDVRVSSHPERVFRAEVHVVTPTIDAETRTRRVKALLPNPGSELLPGTFARIDLGVSERSGVVMVPKEALQVSADGNALYRLVGNDRVERLTVETGLYRDGRVEVRSGVAAGDWIVVRGQAGLVDGSPVSLRRPDGAPLDALAPPVAQAEPEPRE